MPHKWAWQKEDKTELSNTNSNTHWRTLIIYTVNNVHQTTQGNLP